ncbi:enoyl-CoA hydratase/isomerase family protein [Thalassorhabdomicrobium marinisediminis]|uniref:Enoyl-CoA hydratase n=1 Tax=Thalassorhabdomicrobium marinisediminis TaxID=2170577 RepID=A0A2T7G094_9RHOB|nr:enoyl-CoA hydratase/isomerase family protein [Thalassorhabdomicrobium marinisediminis]PVA07808.1 enoyl-CoA hydratase [Thalassorhabdomicrobium marinisediminis]
MIAHDVSDGCLTLTLNRPDKANALSEAMLAELADAVEGATHPVLVLTGAGSVFSAGADLEEVRRAALATSPQWERLSTAVAGFEGLSVAALNGACAGGALGMVLACDLRIAVAGARFFYPVVKMGVLPQPSDPARLVALAGPATAKRILLCGAKLSAEEALATGLIDHICTGALDAAVTEMTETARAADPAHLRAIKRMIPQPL